jgi:FtsP/CotA-like multicopper oxidase with cupredoxin domain
MPRHDNDHAHKPHGHTHTGAVAQAPEGDASEAYRRACAAAQPDADRTVIPIELEARDLDWIIAPGVTTQGWGFNGQVPGPTIEAQVGDVLEIRLTNHLPEPTVVHWHGLRIPAAMDGTEMVQRPVKPGDTFVYRFKLPDAGTFWYHTHFNETVQLERGLYGALVVRSGDEPTFDRERVLVFDDVELGDDGTIKAPGGWLESHDGREGSTRLVNGKREPELTIAAGQIERWRLINAASARYVRLSIGGCPFRIIGTDGGLIGSPVTATEILLAPADRVELAVGPFAEGEIHRVETLPFKRGSFKAHRKPELFATLRVGRQVPSKAHLPETLRRIEPLVTGLVKVSREVRLGFTLGLEHGVEFTINKEQHHRADPVRVDELQVWDVINRSPVHHPFHLHGFFFQVLQVNGKTPEFLSWEDTVNVPAFGSVRIAWMPDDRPGEWMYHCHILEHHAAGMMAHFDVVR